MTVRKVDNGFDQSLDDQSYFNSKEHEVPEDSQQSEPRSFRQRPGRKRKSELNQTRTMKAAVGEAKMILVDNTEEPEPSDSKQVHEENAGTSSHTTEKRTHNYVSKHSRESELDAADGEECSYTVIAGGQEKRLREVAPVCQTPYNLKRHKT
ncbi:hypothetical protein SLA2020_090220 [Shorea laevis]